MANTPFGTTLTAQDTFASMRQIEEKIAYDERLRRLEADRRARMDGVDRMVLPRPSNVLHKLGNGYLLSAFPSADFEAMSEHLYFPDLVALGNYFISLAAQQALEAEEKQRYAAANTARAAYTGGVVKVTP